MHPQHLRLQREGNHRPREDEAVAPAHRLHQPEQRHGLEQPAQGRGVAHGELLQLGGAGQRRAGPCLRVLPAQGEPPAIDRGDDAQRPQQRPAILGRGAQFPHLAPAGRQRGLEGAAAARGAAAQRGLAQHARRIHAPRGLHGEDLALRADQHLVEAQVEVQRRLG